MCNLLALPLTGQVEVCQGLSLSFPIIEVEGLVDSTSGPWTGSISITWQLLETQILECHLDLIDKRLLGWGGGLTIPGDVDTYSNFASTETHNLLGSLLY